MEIAVTFPNRPTTKETLTYMKTLSQGKLEVYQVFSISRQKDFALKAFPKSTFGTAQYQKEKLMFKLKHPNIIQRVPMTWQNDKFHAILTEFAKYGDFFNLVTKNLLNSEVYVRTYFHQLIDGLEYIHSQGVAHLDLKLENIMLGSDYRLKIIDFDQAQLINEKSISSGGTVSYRAPEVQDGSCANLGAADIFSAGIILYTFRAKEFPFTEKIEPSCKETNSYAYYTKNPAQYWQHKIEKKGEENCLTKELLDLVDGMLNPDSEKRFTLKDIKESKWYKGPVLDYERLKTEMKIRLEGMKDKEKECITKKAPVLVQEPKRRD